MTVFAIAFSFVLQARQPLDFAYFGCNRVSDKVEKAQKAENPSSANVSELLATFRDVSAIKPRFLFALGDIVNNYKDDEGKHLRKQLEAWHDLVKLDPAVELVVAPGNHELNKKVGDAKLANLATDAIWTKWAGEHGYDRRAGNGPTPANDPEDKLVDDQSRLNYSFTVGSTHFIVLNTDTRTSVTAPGSTEALVGWVPAHWVAKDLAQAEADTAVHDVFLLGHRNLVTPTGSKEDAPIEESCAKTLVAAIGHSPKVRAFLCSHVHAWDVAPIPGTKAKQVVLGNGGSDLNKEWNPADGRWFGFALVHVAADGAVTVTPYRRPAPEETAPVGAHVAPAKPDKAISL